MELQTVPDGVPAGPPPADRAARAARVRAQRASRLAGVAERRARVGGSQVLHLREAQRLRALAAGHLAAARQLERHAEAVPA